MQRRSQTTAQARPRRGTAAKKTAAKKSRAAPSKSKPSAAAKSSKAKSKKAAVKKKAAAEGETDEPASESDGEKGAPREEETPTQDENDGPEIPREEGDKSVPPEDQDDEDGDDGDKTEDRSDGHKSPPRDDLPPNRTPTPPNRTPTPPNRTPTPPNRTPTPPNRMPTPPDRTPTPPNPSNPPNPAPNPPNPTPNPSNPPNPTPTPLNPTPTLNPTSTPSNPTPDAPTYPPIPYPPTAVPSNPTPVPSTSTPVPSNSTPVPVNPVANPGAGASVALDGASWRGRNPDAPTQPDRERERPPHVEMTDAEKNAAQLKRQLNADSKTAYEAAIADWDKTMDEKAEELSKIFDKTPQEIKKALRGKTNLARERAHNLQNAKVWKFAQEVNADRPVGSKLKAPELNKMLKEDGRFDDMTQEEQDVLLIEFEESRGLKKSGTRLNNAAAARDVTAFTKRIDKELNLLNKRTGAIGLCFDNYGVNRDSIGVGVTFDVLRKQTIQMISDGLERAVNKKIAMKYADYDDIPTEYGVELVGWPEEIEFLAPSVLGSVERLRPLYDALVAGTCRWEKMSASRLEAHKAEVAAKGTKKKKERRDKGLTREEAQELREKEVRKKKAKDDDEEVVGKRKKHSSMTPEELAEHLRTLNRDKKRRQRAKARGDPIPAPSRARKSARSKKSRDVLSDTSDEGDEEEWVPVTAKGGKKRKVPESDDESAEDEDEGEGRKKKGKAGKRRKVGGDEGAKGGGVKAKGKRGKKRKATEEDEESGEDEDEDEDEDESGKKKKKAKVAHSDSSDNDSVPSPPHSPLPFSAKPKKPYVAALNLAATNNRAALKKQAEIRHALSPLKPSGQGPCPLPKPAFKGTAVHGGGTASGGGGTGATPTPGASTSQLPKVLGLSQIDGYESGESSGSGGD
ncbi:hypothetical protein C8F04DRAFT_1265180 [Mycena alexandri]|uniref:Uncharacterized protein n=1 Tax=Mycena alexandri TaxID=1745969 RepID=A0AAD6SKT5_9AGAR|nr:hypothetical protein C8F04DRAFT_1265180 [Mycena alexandri]